MSATAMGMALEVPDISPRAKIVLIAICNCANEYTFEGFPGRKDLARVAFCSLDTIDRCIRELIDAGVLEKTERERDDGRGLTSNLYRVFPMHDPSRKSAATPSREIAATPSRETAAGGNAEMRLPQPHSYAATLAARDAATKEPLNEPSKEEREESARASDDVTPSMLEALKARAEGVLNLSSANVHHPAALRQLMREGCTWQDIEDATDAAAGAIRAQKGRPIYSWAFIREGALQNRDRRAQPLAPVAEPKPQRPGKASYSEIIQRVGKEFGH